MQLNQGDTAAARTCLAEALAIFRAAGDAAVVAHTLIELGWAVYLAHDQQASLPLFRECLDLAQGLGDDSLTAHALTSLTHVLVYEGACTPELLAAIEQAVALYRRLQDGPGLAQALLTLATFHTQTGALAAALAAAEAAEATLAPGDQAGTRAWTHAMVAELLLLAIPDPAGLLPATPAATPPATPAPTLAAADPAPTLAASEARLQTALAHFTAAHQRDGILIVRHHLGDLALKRGRLAEAAALYTDSHAAALAGGDQRMTARCLMGLGRVALAAGDLPTARRHLAAGRALLAALPAFLPPAVQAAYAAAWAAAWPAVTP
jgi:tetratricopeptide (TPR) repeat protein